ncbi:hypothetical protein D3C81_2003660 [compost metagenome]
MYDAGGHQIRSVALTEECHGSTDSDDQTEDGNDFGADCHVVDLGEDRGRPDNQGGLDEDQDQGRDSPCRRAVLPTQQWE